jgi:hypothetical protein
MWEYTKFQEQQAERRNTGRKHPDREKRNGFFGSDDRAEYRNI